MQHTNTFTIIKAGPIFELSEWRLIILLQAANEYDLKKKKKTKSEEQQFYANVDAIYHGDFFKH